MGGQVGPRAALDMVVKRNIPSPCQESNPACPAHSPMIYKSNVTNILTVTCPLTVIYMVKESESGCIIQNHLLPLILNTRFLTENATKNNVPAFSVSPSIYILSSE